MKFNKIRLVGASNVDFPIVDADPAGPFVLKNADGLGPPDITLRRGKTVQEGSIRQGRRAEDRQIIMRVGLQPDWDVGQTAEQVRANLYNLLTPRFGNPVKVQLMLNDVVVGVAQGDISRFEVVIFSKDPEVQITLDCDYPYLLAPAVQYQTPIKTVIGGMTALDIVNDGTAPAGFFLGIKFLAPVTGSLQLLEDAPFGLRMSLHNVSFAANDSVTFNTAAGTRGVHKVTPSGVSTTLLNNLDGASAWLQLYGGNNRLLINNTNFDWYFTGFSHTPAHWGV